MGKFENVIDTKRIVSMRKMWVAVTVSVFYFTLIFLSGSRAFAEDRKVLFMGDSITAGMGVTPEQAYPALIQRILKEKGKMDVTVINASISGSTTAGAWSRLNWYLKAKPSILVLALGANDGLRGLSTREMAKNLDRAIVLARENKIQVILAGMEIPPNYGADYALDFRRVFPELAVRHKIVLIPFLLQGVAGQAGLNQADGIHPNVRGQRIIAKTVIPYILESL